MPDRHPGGVAVAGFAGAGHVNMVTERPQVHTTGGVFWWIEVDSSSTLWDMTEHTVKTDGNAIRALRIAGGLTIRQLAKATGVDHGTISKVERGLMEASPRTIRAIADLLDVPAISLLSGVPDRLAA